MVNKQTISIGIIGYNKGNGHPYSFSAIVNGFNKIHMQNCPYPVIYDYLSRRDPIEFGVKNLSIDYVWTQDKNISEDIAKSSNIPYILDDYTDMIGKVDAVIIARDDADCHKTIAESFLNEGMFVFIDKPLCDNNDDLNFFIPFLMNGQLMSCSGFRFHPFFLNKVFLQEKREKVLSGYAVTSIDWFKYGIHVIEAMQPLMNSSVKYVQNIGKDEKDIVHLEYENKKDAIVMKIPNIKGFYTNFYFSDEDALQIKYNDNFSYFRNLLFMFHDFITEKKHVYPYNETINLIKVLIAAKESKADNNKKITIL